MRVPKSAIIVENSKSKSGSHVLISIVFDLPSSSFLEAEKIILKVFGAQFFAHGT